MDDWPIQPVLSAGKFSSHLGRRIWARKQSIKLKNILVNCIHCNMGQTVEKPRVQPGKAVPREFPRAQPEGTPETECWYFPVLPDSSQGTDIIQFIKVMKL